MVALAKNGLLGLGLYTAAEAAMYAQVPAQTMNRWIYGDKRGESVLRPQLAGTNARFITFLDFVQSLAIRQIRSDHKVPLSKIRQAIGQASKRYGVDYPLAQRHTVFCTARN